MKKSCRGQTATEMLMIIAFVVLLAAIVIITSSQVAVATANSVHNVQIIPKT